VGHDLVAIEIKVDPLWRTAALGTAQGLTIEGSGLGQVINREGQVKGVKGC
jgi:hypothetical protein